MGWVAAEPVSLVERRSKIAEWSMRWEDDEDFSYAITDEVGGELLGACGMHRRIAPDGLELGYWVRKDRIGQGVATDAVRALVAAAFSIEGITHVEIRHDAANVASRRVPEKLGFTDVEERRDEVAAPAEVGTDVIWRLHRGLIHAVTATLLGRSVRRGTPDDSIGTCERDLARHQLRERV